MRQRIESLEQFRALQADYMAARDAEKRKILVCCGTGCVAGGNLNVYHELKKRMDELGLKKEDYWWYLDLRRYGSCRHAGYGLGFERMVMYLTGVSNIRDVELHPRTVGNAEF